MVMPSTWHYPRSTLARLCLAPYIVMNATSHSSPVNWAALPVLLAGAFMVVLDFFLTMPHRFH